MATVKQQKIFPVQEIGSITKPGWRVRGVSGTARIGDDDIQEAALWGARLDVPDHQELVDLLRRRQTSGAPPTEEEKQEIREWSARYVLKLFEKAGLDIVFSGEQWRVEMYEHAVRNIDGFSLLGSVQSFDYKYYTKGAVIGVPSFVRPIYLDEMTFTQGETGSEIKVPITGPYTIVDWSFNEFYEKKLRSSGTAGTDLSEAYFEARKESILDLVDRVLRREIAILAENGVRRIDIDEPAVTTKPNEREMNLFTEAINALTRGFDDIVFGLHNCYSDYALLGRHLPRLRDISEVTLEFANHDGTDLGVNSASRPGYSELSVIERGGYLGRYGLGIVHVHDYTGHLGNGAVRDGKNVLESPQLVRDRILYAAEVIGDPYRISVNPDCGLRTRSWEVIYNKLAAISEGAALARQKFE